MKRFAISLGAVLACALSATHVPAAEGLKYGTARFFYDACKASLNDKNTQDLFNQGECVGMLRALSFYSEQLSARFKFCSPGNVTGAQLVSVALKYMDIHPEKLDTPLMEIANTAFVLEWPCK